MKAIFLVEGIYQDENGKYNYDKKEIRIEIKDDLSISEIDDYFTNLDKSELMNDYFIDLIINWELDSIEDKDGIITFVKDESDFYYFEKVFKHLININLISYEAYTDYFAVLTKLRPEIRTLPLEKQIKIVMLSLNAVYIGSIISIEKILNLFRKKIG